MLNAGRLLAFAALVMVVPVRAAEPSWRDFKDVANTSFVEPSGERSIQLSIEVPASPHEAFSAFTTSDGFSSWAVPIAKVDFRIGGYIEASYDSKAKIGDPGNIKNAIVAYVPDRVLVIRNIQAPVEFADTELFQRTVTIIEFAAIEPHRTRVTITNAGYGTGERFNTLYRHFEWGDAYTLQTLRTRFEKGPVDWSAKKTKAKSEAAAETVTKSD
jgi:uncharacterized protein YndB with AHSA1/START domain